MAITSGFKGLAYIDYSEYTDVDSEVESSTVSVPIRCTDFGVNLEQDVKFYEHTIGLRDTIPTNGAQTKGEQTDPVDVNYQKYFFRPGVKIIRGSMGFPATIENLETVFYLAKTGQNFKLTFYYDCNIKREYTKCKINSFTFNATAGDIITVTLDIIGRFITESYNKHTDYTVIQKLITWDVVKPTIILNVLNSSGTVVHTTLTDPIKTMEFTVNNNCIPIYTSGGNSKNSLFPLDIRVGMQEVTGSLSYYIKGTGINALSPNATTSTIKIYMEDPDALPDPFVFDHTLNVILKPIQRSGAIGAVISTLAFVGIDHALGA